jgi:hypothetical protein
MTTRLCLVTVSMFVLGFYVGSHFPVELYRFLAPERLDRLLTEALIDPFLLRFWAGGGVGCLFAAAPVAVLLSGRCAAWPWQVLAYLFGGSFVSLAAAQFCRRVHDFCWESPVFILPLCGATAALVLGVALRVIYDLQHHESSAPNVA